MKNFLLFPTLICFAMPVWAQAPQEPATPIANPSKPELPSGPLLSPVGEFAQWEVSFTYPEDEKKLEKGPDRSLAERLRKTVTTKTGRVVHETQTRIDKSVLELWYSGPTQYVKLGNNPTWFELTVGEMAHTSLPSSASPLPLSGFRDVDFIHESNYAGTIAYGKGKCLVFTPGGYKKLDLSDTAQMKRMETIDVIGYVDEDSRFPLAVRAHGVLRTFHFKPPPTEMQTFPADLSDQLKKGDEGSARLARPAPRPY